MKTIHRNIDRVLWPLERKDYLFIAGGFCVGYVLIGSWWLGVLTAVVASVWRLKLRKGQPERYIR